MEPNALDHILVGGGIELSAASREAAVYDRSGRLLDYFKEKEAYMAQLEQRVTFSDHFFNIIHID
jgi:hypothetical protein